MKRAMLYRLAVETGLRVNELKSLTASSFDLEDCTVTVKAGYSKRRREDTLPLKADTCQALKTLLQNKTPQAKVFRVTTKTAKMLKADMAEARQIWIEQAQGNPQEHKKRQKSAYLLYETDRGTADFHSLRHTTGSFLAASGVHPKVAQEIMRHSDINLTMSRYSHTLIGQTSAAIEGLPDLSLPSKESQKEKATGTDDSNVTSDCAYRPAYRKLTGKAYSDKTGMSSVGTVGKMESDSSDLCNSRIHDHLDTACPPLSSKKKRSRKDSNPRNLSVQWFSRPSRSATLPLLQKHISCW
jgi:hypothetical protein